MSGTNAGRPIVIFDSGIGGLPYLESARSALPGESFIYLADRAGFPYGTLAVNVLGCFVIGLLMISLEERFLALSELEEDVGVVNRAS